MLMLDQRPVSDDIRLIAFRRAFGALREFALDPSQGEPFVPVLSDDRFHRLMFISDIFSALTDCDDVIPGLFKNDPEGIPHPQTYAEAATFFLSEVERLKREGVGHGPTFDRGQL